LNLQQMKWPAMLIAMAVTLSVMFGGSMLMKSRTVDEPLRTFYAADPSVASYVWEHTATGYAITVRLKETTDLQTVYLQLDSGTKKIMKGSPYTITIEDQRSAPLVQVAQQMNLYVQESLATGQFTTMADRVALEASKVGATGKMSVDSERVYLTVQDSSGYLYSVVERPKSVPANANNGSVVL
jgi:hypothetical protein